MSKDEPKVTADEPIKAKIVKVTDKFNPKFQRVYELKFNGKFVGRYCLAKLDFGAFLDEKQLFFNITPDNTVNTNIHRCPDLKEMPNTYYAWQPRLPRPPTSCPRCKRRLDMVSSRGA